MGSCPPSIGQLWMIRLADHVEHDGARAEVERDARSHVEIPVAVQPQLAQAPPLDVVHPNRGPDRRAFSDGGIAEKTTIRDDGLQSVQVNDVEDLRISRRRHVTISLLPGIPPSFRRPRTTRVAELPEARPMDRPSAGARSTPPRSTGTCGSRCSRTRYLRPARTIRSDSVDRVRPRRHAPLTGSRQRARRGIRQAAGCPARPIR